MNGIYLLVIIPAFLFQTVFGQEEIIFQGKTNPLEVKSGTNVIIPCTVSEDTPDASSAAYEWFDNKGYKVVTSNSGGHAYLRNNSNVLRLHINNITEDDAGKYKCVAKVNQQMLEKTIQIIVKASIKFSDCMEKQVAVLDKSAQIRCTASATGISVTTIWEKGGNVLEGNASGKYRIDRSLLTIMNVTEEDAGVYKFVANQGDEEQKDIDITVIVLVGPKITAPILSMEVIVGNKSTLHCTATGKPLPAIYWYKDESSDALIDTDRLTIKQINREAETEGVLEIRHARQEDGGQYRCVAKNEASEKSLADEAATSINVTVLMPPTITTMKKTLGKVGESVALICEAHGYPIPTMVWSKGDGSPVTEGSDKDISITPQANVDNPGAKLTIKFSKLKKSDAATYACTATSKAGSVTKSVELVINFAPDFDAQETNIFYNWLDNKDAYNMLCIANGNPAPVIMWSKDGKKINDGNDFYNIATQINDTDPYQVISKLNVTYNGQNEEIFGIYVCEAENNESEAIQNLTLSKAERPKKPSVFLQESGATFFRILLLEKYIDGPELQHFEVEYKKLGSSDDTEKKVVAKERGTDVDGSTKYTEIRLDGLSPSTEYVLTFYARNAVGLGEPEEIQQQTLNISVPDIVDIKTLQFVSDSTLIDLEWTQPKDGGSTISKYKIEYRPVSITFNTSADFTKSYEQKALEEYKVADNIIKTKHRLTNLIPRTFYEVSVVAVNKAGASLPTKTFIQTKAAEKVSEAKTEPLSSLSTSVIIGICVGIIFILFIIVDTICYFKNDCGVLNNIRKRFGGSSRGGGYTVANEKDEKAGLHEEKSNLLQPGEQKVDTVDETDQKSEGNEEKAELKEKQMDEQTAIPDNTTTEESTKEPDQPDSPPPGNQDASKTVE